MPNQSPNLAPNQQPNQRDLPLASPMRMALTVLLDSVPDSRKVLRHLAAVEHDLGVKDGHGKFLRKAPPDRLVIVLRQLDGLLNDAPPPGLLALREILVEAIAPPPPREAAQLTQPLPLSGFLEDDKLEVSEVRASAFDQLQAVWNPDAFSARPAS